MSTMDMDWKSASLALLSTPAKVIAESEAAAATAPERTITAWQLACLGFMCVCAGPYGIEDAVGAAGALPVLAACFLLPLFWGLPQSLITAELSTMMDENGGYILWVRRGMGNFWGWMSAYNSLGSNICDLPLYAILLSQYVQAFLQRTFNYSLTWLGMWLIKFGALLFTTVINIKGVSEVSAVSIFITALIVLPFILEPFVAAKHLEPANWLTTTPTIQWGLFMSTMLWNFQGWDGLGCVAGEVKDGGRTYPKGVCITLMMITLTYAVPVAVGVSIIPDLGQWQSGLIETIAHQISPWLGWWVVVGAMLSQVGEFNVIMCNSSRALWAMAKRKMVPPILGTSSRRYKTPVAAILCQFVTTGVLMTFGFQVLVVIDTFLNNVSLALESLSFVMLRFRQPDAPRPYKVPGGKVVAICVTIPKLIIITFSCASAGTFALLLCGGANVLFVLMYLLRQWIVPRDDPTNFMDKGEATPSQTPESEPVATGGTVIVSHYASYEDAPDRAEPVSFRHGEVSLHDVRETFSV